MTRISTDHWKVISVGDTLTFRVPAVAEEQHLQAIDTLADVITGPGYEIMYEYGQFGGRIEPFQSRPGYTTRERIVDGRRAQEASFQASALQVVHLLQITLDRGAIFSLRLSCADESSCDLHDALFDSIRVK